MQPLHICKAITFQPSKQESHTSWTLGLASFGGAGGHHACEITSLLGIKTILIHWYSSILSAYRLALADQYVHISLNLLPTDTMQVCTKFRNQHQCFTQWRTCQHLPHVWTFSPMQHRKSSSNRASLLSIFESSVCSICVLMVWMQHSWSFRRLVKVPMTTSEPSIVHTKPSSGFFWLRRMSWRIISRFTVSAQLVTSQTDRFLISLTG
jgi:Hydantoinase/oxoprolinase